MRAGKGAISGSYKKEQGMNDPRQRRQWGEFVSGSGAMVTGVNVVKPGR
jgi:hypothetical protein